MVNSVRNTFKIIDLVLNARDFVEELTKKIQI